MSKLFTTMSRKVMHIPPYHEKQLSFFANENLQLIDNQYPDLTLIRMQMVYCKYPFGIRCSLLKLSDYGGIDYWIKPNIIPNSAVKVLKNRIMLIMRVNPDVRIVSMVSVNH